MGALLSLPLLAIPSASTLITLATSCCGAATCSAVCSACGKFQNSMATRIAYAFILLFNSIVSWIMLTPWALRKLQHMTLDYMEIRCDGKDCHGWVAVHRINFGLGLFHLILAFALLGVRSSKDGRAVLQNGFWGPKIILWLALVVASFFIPESFFFVYGHYIAFFCAMLFLLLGLILLVDLAHSWAEICLQKIEDHDSRTWRGLLIGSTVGMYLASLVMTILMYVFFAHSGCSMNQAAITINLVIFLIISIISVQPIVQESNSRAGLAQAAMVTVYCTYLTMSAVSMEPDDRHCNPLIRAKGTRTASIVLGAIVTMATIAYTTTRAATQGIALGSKGGHSYSQLQSDDNEHGLVTQQPTSRREMRAEVLRAAVASGSLPASALDESDDESDEYDTKDDEKGSTQYNYSLFHIIFFLATTWVATLLTQNLDPEAADDFAPVGRTYWASWVKIISAWVHQIQSGQVITDLCSVAKELVENSLDAGATSIEIRFKNNGLDLIEVQDNGGGIAPENYESLALKHHTSKLTTFTDLSTLQTFGFRGEALSSLCAVSTFRVTTAQAHQVPKATRLEFATSGRLQNTQIVAGQKGTTATVEQIFRTLPVRRRELEKNIKREYTKVLNLLHAYACISTGVRFCVRNITTATQKQQKVSAQRNVVVFSTNGNATTKANLANVYGAKTLTALMELGLELEFGGHSKERIRVSGFVSRPVVGEGRQTPDRQMFFVNARPCALPQIARAFNEVYRSYNVAQAPFVFANLELDTAAYDVNVSPDKRTILLHEAGSLIEELKVALAGLFGAAEQSVPQVVLGRQSRLLGMGSGRSMSGDGAGVGGEGEKDEKEKPQASAQDRMKSFLSGLGAGDSRVDTVDEPQEAIPQAPQTQPDSPEAEEDNELFVRQTSTPPKTRQEPHSQDETVPTQDRQADAPSSQPIASTQGSLPSEETPNIIQNAFDRMRPRRMPAEIATITIGDRTVTSVVGSGVPKKRFSDTTASSGSTRKRRIHTPSRPSIFGKHMRDFAAPGSQLAQDESEQEEEIEDDGCSDELEEEPEDMEEEADEGDIEGDEAEEMKAASSQPSLHSDHESVSEAGDVDEAAAEETAPQTISENMSEEEKKQHEEAEVQRLIRQAEEKAALPHNSEQRANKMNKGAAHRDSTVQLVATVDGSLSKIQSQFRQLQHCFRRADAASSGAQAEVAASQETAEERLSLTVSKDDFAGMRIIGQFNLGFILATRSRGTASGAQDELFIIDQHASDEKYNFERLQAETVVQNQRLVRPKQLDLTAVEEEIVIENQAALEKNGFVVEVDDSGDEPIGRRCKLVSLPLSKEVVFGERDLEELIVLLSEMPSTSGGGGADGARYIPRPTKVRKMFAMRACRSSIMIGKNLTTKQMQRVVRNMGTIDKPWNCPHGRPTMRHLMSLGEWDEWDEWGDEADDGRDRLDIWRDFFGAVEDEEEE
ncbi:Serinc-domain-containing protein [Aspergillus homomorphus CBS 101889]|uniref:DNA mismatch repair protein PMS1 n=1 Tax=Aspergillus homomorphus (strain CBS 101889) TaxID=1450537 RepID=A0A395I0P3_ASPHC|nr:Serinc-domain-containing protein [Aspergillus homomorphus CBS 101889]RAL13761.1 Serinc-domain-containing protein [Aspergillus homomorphus CBS 101889]